MDKLSKLREAQDILCPLYWDMIDNHENQKQCKRLDTILGKLTELEQIMMEEKRHVS